MGKRKKDVEKWLDFSQLPKFTFGNSERIMWQNSSGCSIPFKYGDIESQINILDCRLTLCGSNKKHSELLITIDRYVNTPMWLTAQYINKYKFIAFITKSMQPSIRISEKNWVDLSGLPTISRGGHFGDIDWSGSFGKHISFQYENISGQILIGKYRRPKIEIFIDKYMLEPKFVPTQSVLECRLFDILGGRIIDVRPDLIQYLEHPQDAYLYNIFSNQVIDIICPFCGYKKPTTVVELSQYGIACPACSDGISFPNKFLTNMFTQTNITFKRELSRRYRGFEWVGKYKYDIYFILNGQQYIVEADGGQHKDKNQQKTDDIKTKLAQQHGCIVIRIDCDYGSSNMDRGTFIKEKVLNSSLAQLIDLSDIDWVQCNQFATTSLIKEACVLWEDSLSLTQIARLLNISKTTVKRYLRIGHELGICNTYNAYNARYRGRMNVWHPVGVFRDNILVDACESVQAVYMKYCGKHDMPNSYNGFNAICRRQSSKEYDGFTLRFLTREEYEQYKVINNEVVLKEAI